MFKETIRFMEICPKCKAQYEDEKICSECGAIIGGETEETESGENKFSVEMVKVEGGTLTLGSDDEDDNPEHDVTLDDFYMAKYEVTQRLYEDVMGENPSVFNEPERPVENVGWYDAVEFCNELSKKDGLDPCYKIDKSHKDPNNEDDYDDVKWTVHCDWAANGYRLPTEAEWEYAAKGGQKSEGTDYAGSHFIDEVAWYECNI